MNKLRDYRRKLLRLSRETKSLTPRSKGLELFSRLIMKKMKLFSNCNKSLNIKIHLFQKEMSELMI